MIRFQMGKRLGLLGPSQSLSFGGSVDLCQQKASQNEEGDDGQDRSSGVEIR